MICLVVDFKPFRESRGWAVITITVITVLFTRVAIAVFSLYNLLIIN